MTIEDHHIRAPGLRVGSIVIPVDDLTLADPEASRFDVVQP